MFAARLVLPLVLAVAAVPVLADEVHLRSGRVLRGEVVARTADSLVLDVAAGQVTLPLSAVARVVEGASALSEYRRRAGRLAAADAAGWLELGLWAREQGLTTQAREAFTRVVAIEPTSAVAQQALGNVMVDGRWLSHDDAQRARGLVPYEGRWMAPEEQRALLAERAADAAARRATAEADARAREAEARARVAEADARRAEREADEAATSGLPYPYVFGPAVPIVIVQRPPRNHPPHQPAAAPSPRPVPQRRPVDRGATTMPAER